MSDDEFVFNPVQVLEFTAFAEGTVGRAVTPPECDFCLDSRVRWSYDCDQFTLPDIGVGSHDGWAACDRCADLIDAGDGEALAKRSIRSWNLRGNPPKPAFYRQIRAIQAGFLEHRSSERQAFG